LLSRESPIPRFRWSGPAFTREHLDLSSEQFDAVLSTWTLCTIPDRAAVLAQIRHVLKPGGAVRFVEHGHAPAAKVTR